MSSTMRHTIRLLKAAKHRSGLRLKSTDSKILTSVFKDINHNYNTVNDFVWQNLDRWPDKTATVCALTGHGYTYALTHRMSVTFAASLHKKLKLRSDDKVAIILPNLPEYPVSILGVLQAGCVASMMNPAYTAYELQRQLKLINCKAIIASKLSYKNIKEALNALQISIPIILTDNEDLPEGTIKFAELAEDFNIDTDCLKSVQRSSKDLAILPFSSGTTGFPKAVALTHGSVVAMNEMIADPDVVVIKETTANYQAVLPAILPFFHIFGFNSLLMNQMMMGCKLVTMPYFKPDLFLQTLVRFKASVLFIVPPMVVFLGKHPAVKPEHLESVYGIISGAAPLSDSDAAAVLAKNKNISFRQGYGLTETNGAISVGNNTDTNHSSVGFVLPSSEVKIVDVNTQEALGAGQEGEIWSRGPHVMSGYYLDDAATKEVITEDGWFKTGDIGKYDENKYLYITDRLKELIKVKGFQVPPAELETILRTHPKILDCAVLGIPDSISGEVPKAFLVPQQGQEITPEEIMDYVNSKVAVFKSIKAVQVVEEIPKNPAGPLSSSKVTPLERARFAFAMPNSSSRSSVSWQNVRATMNSLARKLILRELNFLKLERKLSASATLKKNEFIIRSSLPDFEITNERFIDRLWKNISSYKDHIALESAETKKAYTYSQFQHHTATFATSLLKKLGLKQGDVVAVMLPNSPEFPVVAFGTLQAGCVLTTVNPIYKEYEIDHQITLTEPKVLITIPECYDNVLKGLKNSKHNVKIVFIDTPQTVIPSGVIRYSEIAESGEVDYGLLDKIERKLDDIACIPFSSGTTGLPKGVEISHKNLMAAIETMSYDENCYPIMANENYQDILPCFLPFFHVYGLVVNLLGHLNHGCKLVTMSKFSASVYLDLLKTQPMNLLYIVPPVAILLGKHPDVSEVHFRNVRNVACGAAPLAASDVQAILEKSKRDIEFNQGFGATETTSLGTSTFKNTKNIDFSACGVPMAGVTMKFIDPVTGQPVPIGQPGELCVKSPTVMKGYHKNPQATADTMSEDNYFKTGDLGYYKPGVGLFITDRIKELIKVKGMQVAPAELESILRSHPSVQDAAVIGVPHEFYGEAPKAFIIKKQGQTTTEEELQDFVANKVANYKRIEEVMFVQDIPKTASGKILRKDLKKIYA